MNNYRVSFFKVDKEEDEDTGVITKEEKYLGSVVLDDYGLSSNLTLIGKAFRHTGNSMIMANKIIVERVK